MKLKKYQVNNKTYITIVDSYDCPIDPYCSCYLMSTTKPGAFNTPSRNANELLYVLSYFHNIPIDLTSRVANGELIDSIEYSKFYTQSFYQKSFKYSQKYTSFINIESKRFRNILAANFNNERKLSPETIRGRIRRLREYITWLYKKFHSTYIVSQELEDRYEKLMCEIKLNESNFGRNLNQKIHHRQESAIPQHIYEKLKEVILPSSPNNPFSISKLRNYLIISIFMSSGIRRGALAKIKISDCLFYGSYDRISIYHTENDNSDSRPDKPNQKTLSHDITIESELMLMIKHYINTVRAIFPKSNTHDFIFISEQDCRGTAGEPLSLKAIDNIFNRLSEKLNFKFTSHTMRYKWNEVLEKRAAKNNIDTLTLERIRRDAMGWNDKSNMAQLYNEKSIQQQADALMFEHQKNTDI